MIEKILGSKLNDAVEHSITSLNDVPLALVAVARPLPPVLRLAFFHFYVAVSEHEYLPLFIEDVVDREIDPASWRKGRFLISFPPIEILVTLSVTELLSLVDGVADSADWKRIENSLGAWKSGDTTSGIPGLLRRDLDYHYSAPPDVLDFLLDDSLKLEDVGDLAVAVRRSMASRIARHLLRVGLKPSDEAEELLATAFPGLQASDDVITATNAMIREASQYGDKDGMPGFLGPDDWYRARNR